MYVEGLTAPSALIYLFPDHFLPPLRLMQLMFGVRGFKSPTSNVSVDERSVSIMIIAGSLIWLEEKGLVYMDLSEESIFSGLIKFPVVVVRKATSTDLGDNSLENTILTKVLMEDRPLSVYNITRKILDLRGVSGFFGIPTSSSFILKLVETHLTEKGIIRIDGSILFKKIKVEKNRILSLDKNLEDVKNLLSNFKSNNPMVFQRIIENIDRGFYSKLPIIWLLLLILLAFITFLRAHLLWYESNHEPWRSYNSSSP
ncbi:MAG: hypothetical protein QXR44_05920 [Thermoproteota archaeon]